MYAVRDQLHDRLFNWRHPFDYMGLQGKISSYKRVSDSMEGDTQFWRHGMLNVIFIKHAGPNVWFRQS